MKKMCANCGAGHIEERCPNCFPVTAAIASSGGGNKTVLHLPNGDFEVIYTPEHPREGRVEVLVEGCWFTLLPYEPYTIDNAIPPRRAVTH